MGAARATKALALLWLPASVAASIPVGCLRVGEAFVDPIDSNATQKYNSTETAEACQELCAGAETCTHFSYWGDQQDCWLGGDVEFSEVTPTSNGAVAGPKVCADPSPACEAEVDDCFPECDVAAAWPSLGQQPQPLQCWPPDCPSYVVLDDISKGWTGKCKDLVPTPVAEGQTCSQVCLDNPRCSGYQIGLEDSCWTGEGFNCETDFVWNDSFKPPEAKRFMRGTTRVLKTLVGIRIPALEVAFTEEDAQNLGDDAEDECRKICYSVLDCMYWQLSSVSGCYIQGASSAVPFPLQNTNVSAPDIIAGEFLQRSCTSESTKAADEQAKSLLFLVLPLVCCCLCALGAATYACMLQPNQKKAQKRNVKKVSKKRGLQQEPAEVPAEAPAVSAAQAPLMQAYVVPTTYSYMVPVVQTPVTVQQATPSVSTSSRPLLVATPVPASRVVSAGSVAIPTGIA